MPSIIDVEEVSKTRARPIDEVARHIFLRELEHSGSYASAAMKARPHLSNRGSAVSAFKQLEDRDPEFKALVDDALAKVAAEGEAELKQRAFFGIEENVEYATDPKTGEVLTRFNKDTQTAEPIVISRKIKHDNALLIAVTRNALRRLDPDAYAPPTAKKTLHVTGGTNNITATMDLDRLLEHMPRDQRMGFLQAVEKMKLGAGAQQEPIDADADRADPDE